MSRIIHGAMVVSLLLYAVVVHAMRGMLGWEGVIRPGSVEPLRWTLYGFGAIFFLGVLAVRSRALSAEALVEVSRRRGAEAAFGQLQQRMIILLALSEAVAIYGFVLFAVWGAVTDFYVLWGASLLGHLSLTPRRELWEEVAEAGRRA